MSNHTPGPWTVRPIPNPGLVGHTGYAIDFNEDQEQVVDFVYEEADARLIAAAPELLEALEMAMEIGDQCSRGFLCKFQAKARAAIAKARVKP